MDLKKTYTFVLSSLPVPKSNRYMRRKDGKVFKPYKIVKWEQTALKELKIQHPGKCFSVPVKVEVFFILPDRRKRDIDNMLKTLWDILEKASIVENDNLIFETRTVKIYKKGISSTVIKITPREDTPEFEHLFRELVGFSIDLQKGEVFKPKRGRKSKKK
jgi:crossover junction endodeoxyribonuclease RusA